MTLYFVHLDCPGHLYHGPDQKGKKRFQGKETAGCVPLGHRREIPQPQNQPIPQPQEVWSDLCRIPVCLPGSLPPDLYSACYLQVNAAELWSPQTQTWTTMASMHTPREYHGTAILLPEGRSARDQFLLGYTGWREHQQCRTDPNPRR
jgi:hypothetical protein